jgi:hypothetical protein
MPTARTRPPGERFERAAETFERPRFYGLYRHWLKEGDSTLDGVTSPVLSHALASGAGRLECFVLPHRYDHLAPVVDLLGSTVRGTENAAERTSTPVHSRIGTRLSAPNGTPERVAVDGAPEVNRSCAALAASAMRWNRNGA